MSDAPGTRNHFNGVDQPPGGVDTSPIDFVLLDADKLFTRPSENALTAIALVAARVFTLEGS